MAGCDDVPDLLSDNSDDSNEWDEVVEMTEDEKINCIFCQQSFVSVLEAIDHCKVEHEFDLKYLKTKFNMDCYSYIKLINYIRKNNVVPHAAKEWSEPLWLDEEYLKPEMVDGWLTFDLDELDTPPNTSTNYKFHVVNAENGCVTLTEQHFTELQRTIQELNSKIQEKDNQIQEVVSDMDKMKRVMQNLIAAGDAAGSPEETVERCVRTLHVSQDEGYFSTYGHFGIHHEMLSDQVRTLSYRTALLENADTIKGKVVLDLGCGTGILSLFAATAGASKVVGIDQSEIVYHAMDIIRENNMLDKIILVKGRLEDTELPVEKVNIIVSEWMGYFLLFEAMLDSVIYARDHHLAPGGLLLPNRCSLSLIGISDQSRHGELVGFWSDVYGFKMTCMQSDVVLEPVVEVIKPESVLTSLSVITELDLYSCSVSDICFSTNFSLTVLRTDYLTAFSGFFDIFFDLPHPVQFSTSPFCIPTHWKQTVFMLKEPVLLTKDELIQGHIACVRKEIRSLQVTISFQEKTYKYLLS